VELRLTGEAVGEGRLGERDERTPSHKCRERVGPGHGVQQTCDQIGPNAQLHAVESGPDPSPGVTARAECLDCAQVVTIDSEFGQHDAVAVREALHDLVLEGVAFADVEQVAEAAEVEFDLSVETAVARIGDEGKLH
jgi:hypothetical protein